MVGVGIVGDVVEVGNEEAHLRACGDEGRENVGSDDQSLETDVQAGAPDRVDADVIAQLTKVTEELPESDPGAARWVNQVEGEIGRACGGAAAGGQAKERQSRVRSQVGRRDRRAAGEGGVVEEEAFDRRTSHGRWQETDFIKDRVIGIGFDGQGIDLVEHAIEKAVDEDGVHVLIDFVLVDIEVAIAIKVFAWIRPAIGVGVLVHIEEAVSIEVLIDGFQADTRGQRAGGGPGLDETNREVERNGACAWIKVVREQLAVEERDQIRELRKAGGFSGGDGDGKARSVVDVDGETRAAGQMAVGRRRNQERAK